MFLSHVNCCLNLGAGELNNAVSHRNPSALALWPLGEKPDSVAVALVGFISECVGQVVCEPEPLPHTNPHNGELDLLLLLLERKAGLLKGQRGI